MLKKILLGTQLFSAFAFAAFEDYPEIIDYGAFKGSVEIGDYDPLAWDLGYTAWNYGPEIMGVFALLKQEYHIDTVVETGTHRGASARFFSILFENVHTIEILEDSYNISKKFLKNSKNVKSYLGSSEKVLQKLLPSLKEKSVLFYLDAHFYDHWPLLEELEEISKTHKDNCIIVIDDFKVPGRPDIPYDAYGKHECSYEYVASQLNRVFSDYKMYYIIPKDVKARAKFIALPKTWKRS